ncbi:MAG: hypothetical protein RTU09_03940 [Candidatus Thorarchaeota archaeon]
MLLNKPHTIGLDILRTRGGDRLYRFVLRLAGIPTIRAIPSKELVRLGSSVGLEASELEQVAESRPDVNVLPDWLQLILVIIVIFGSYYLWRRFTYLPGTLYGSIGPRDFL